MNGPPAADAATADRVACSAELVNLPRLLALAARVAERLQLDARTRHDLQLIVEEACVNVMRHAYPAARPGPLALAVQVVPQGAGRRLVLTLTDQGRPFDPLSVPTPPIRAAAEARAPGGLGVHLIRQLSDRLHYRHDARHGNVLTIEKQLAPASTD